MKTSRKIRFPLRPGLAFLLGIVVGAALLGTAQRFLPVAATPDRSPPPASVPMDVLAATDVLLSIPPLSQYPAFPTGCELIAATMALRYAGETVSPDTLADRYLSTSTDWYWWAGSYHGPDPCAHFLGNPRKENSYGCFAPVIYRMLTTYLGDDSRVADATGTPLPELCERFLDVGVPVLVWATMEMRPVKAGATWLLPDGTAFTWPAGEHCLLLVGYDEKSYYFNDPRTGTCVAYEKAVCEKRYGELGMQALAVTG